MNTTAHKTSTIRTTRKAFSRTVSFSLSRREIASIGGQASPRLSGTMEILANTVSALAETLIFGGAAYFCYRVYRDPFQTEMVRSMSLMGIFASLVLLASGLYAAIFG